MKKILSFFVKGLIVSIPLVIIIYFLTNTYSFFKKLLPNVHFLLIILVVFAFFTLLGFIFTNKTFKRLTKVFKKKIKKVAPLYLIYVTLEKLMTSHIERKDILKKPAIITDPGTNERKIGFITNDNLAEIGLEDHVTVFFPSAFGVSGETVLIKKEFITLLDTDGTKVYTMLISGGLTIAPDNKVIEETE